MKSWREKIEGVFSAVAFAEAGDSGTSLELAQWNAWDFKVARFLRRASDYMTAAAYAEAGMPETALSIVEVPKPRPVLKLRARNPFLESVGLSNAQVHFGLARV